MCLTPEDALALARWIADVGRAEELVAICRGAPDAAEDVAYQNAPPDAPAPYDLDTLRRALTYPVIAGAALEVRSCKGTVPDGWEANAWWHHDRLTAVLCTEFLDEARGFVGDALVPGFAWWVVAHEFAHGVMWAADVPWTGSMEAAADELAAVWLIAMGFEAHVLAGAAYWDARSRAESHDDPHPGDKRRAWDAVCLVYGSDTVAYESLGAYLGWNGRTCPARWRRTVRTWARLLVPAALGE